MTRHGILFVAQFPQIGRFHEAVYYDDIKILEFLDSKTSLDSEVKIDFVASIENALGRRYVFFSDTSFLR